MSNDEKLGPDSLYHASIILDIDLEFCYINTSYCPSTSSSIPKFCSLGFALFLSINILETCIAQCHCVCLHIDCFKDVKVALIPEILNLFN